MVALFCCDSIYHHLIVTKFCTCHDSTPVMSCAKFCRKHCVKFCIWENWNFLRTWIMMIMVSEMEPGVLCNIGYLDKTLLELISREILFVHNIWFSYLIDLQLYTEHSSTTDIFCAKFQNDWSMGAWVVGKWDLLRFGFKMCFGLTPHIAQGHWYLVMKGCH